MAHMRRRSIIATCAATLAVACAPATAGAATYQGSLTISGPPVASADGSLAYSAVGTLTRTCSPAEFCGYFPLVTTVPAAEACRPDIDSGLAWVGSEVYDDARARVPQTIAPAWREWPSRRSGPTRACLYAGRTGTETLVAETTYDVPVDGSAPPAPSDGSDIPRNAIPRSVGVRRSYSYRLSRANVPPSVDPARFGQLARVGAKRWGLVAAGTTPRAPRSEDGSDTVGFARDVPRDALGITRIRSIRYYRRGPRGKLRFVHERVVERDLSLSYGVRWHAELGAPPSDRVDLQTVLIHELGHFAGNDHVRDCTNSPMWVGLRPGEWWWTRADWFQADCRNAPSAPPATVARAASAAPSTPAARRPLLVQRTVRRVVLG